MTTNTATSYAIYLDEELSEPTEYNSKNSYFQKQLKRLEYSAQWAKPYIQDGVVLDVGASPFFMLNEALCLGASEAHGIFYSEDIHPFAENPSVYTQHGRIDIYHRDVLTEKLPLSDNSVDTALCFETLEHFSVFPFLLLSELNRVIKMDGHLLLTVPNASSLLNLYHIVRGGNPFHPYRTAPSGRHSHEYVRDQLADLFPAAGFETIKCERVQIPVPGRLVRTLAAETMRLPLFSRYRSNIFGIGRKTRNVIDVLPPRSLFIDDLATEGGD